MDKHLRELRRASIAGDPDAQNRYISALERLAGIGDEPVKIWEASMGEYTIARCWSKTQALRELAKYVMVAHVASDFYKDTEDFEKNLSLKALIRLKNMIGYLSKNGILMTRIDTFSHKN